MVDVNREAMRHGGAFGKLADQDGTVLERNLLWFVREANLGPLGHRLVAVASIAKGRRLTDGQYTISLDDGRELSAWLVDDYDLPPSGVRKVSFVVENC